MGKRQVPQLGSRKKTPKISWPKAPLCWNAGGRVLFSVPFTWQLPQVREAIGSLPAKVGGPATLLIPDYFQDMPNVIVGGSYPGMLQRMNPLATRTTVGCPRRCDFCGIGKGFIESGGLQELKDWPDLPIICDNNLLASSESHFIRVIDRLVQWGWADFNQGLDARLLTEFHAKQLARVKKPMVRLALDSMKYKNSWERGYETLRRAGIAKANIRSYCIVAFEDGPQEAWDRCEFVNSFKIKPLPMWYHALDQLTSNIVTQEQEKLGWDEYERKAIMGWYYYRRKP